MASSSSTTPPVSPTITTAMASPRRPAWAAAHDGILVRDANATVRSMDASEFVFGGNGLTDLQALAVQYGSALDANDADFAKFAVWQDANSNGVAEAGEVQSLTALGIASISLSSDGIATRPRTATLRSRAPAATPMPTVRAARLPTPSSRPASAPTVDLRSMSAANNNSVLAGGDCCGGSRSKLGRWPRTITLRPDLAPFWTQSAADKRGVAPKLRCRR